VYYELLLVYANLLDLLGGEGFVREPEDIDRIRREEVEDGDVVDPGSIHVQVHETPENLKSMDFTQVSY
jgi:hypothetical protein